MSNLAKQVSKTEIEERSRLASLAMGTTGMACQAVNAVSALAYEARVWGEIQIIEADVIMEMELGLRRRRRR